MSQSKARARANEKVVSTAATPETLRQAYDAAAKAAKQVGISGIKPFDASKWSAEMTREGVTTRAEFTLEGKPEHESLSIKLHLVIGATIHTLGDVMLSHHAMQATKMQHSLQAMGLWG